MSKAYLIMLAQHFIGAAAFLAIPFYGWTMFWPFAAIWLEGAILARRADEDALGFRFGRMLVLAFPITIASMGSILLLMQAPILYGVAFGVLLAGTLVTPYRGRRRSNLQTKA